MVTLGLACHSPKENMAFVGPDKTHWVAMESLAPDPGKEELLPSLRLSLQNRWSRGPVLMEGMENLCGTHIRWVSDREVMVRLPADRVGFLKLRDGDQWKGVRVKIQVHEDGIRLDRWSKDGQRRLLVIAACESESWNLYLRRAGEPAYNAAMESGWDDPDLFGGFEYTQPPVSLEWTGPRSAEIKVPGKRHDVTLREQAGDVKVKWTFVSKYKLPDMKGEPLKPALR